MIKISVHIYDLKERKDHVLTLAGGAIGVALAYLIAPAVGTLPLLGPLYEDTSGKGDIRLAVSLSTMVLSTGILVLVGVLSGLVPAWRASRLDPVEAPALRIARASSVNSSPLAARTPWTTEQSIPDRDQKTLAQVLSFPPGSAANFKPHLRVDSGWTVLYKTHS